MLVTATACTIMSVPSLIFMKELPKHFPSKVAQQQSFKPNKAYSQKKDLMALVHNKNYLLITLLFMMLYGVYTCLGAVINNIVSPYGYSATDSSLLGATFIFFGLVGSFLFSAILDKT